MLLLTATASSKNRRRRCRAPKHHNTAEHESTDPVNKATWSRLVACPTPSPTQAHHVREPLPSSSEQRLSAVRRFRPTLVTTPQYSRVTVTTMSPAGDQLAPTTGYTITTPPPLPIIHKQIKGFCFTCEQSKTTPNCAHPSFWQTG